MIRFYLLIISALLLFQVDAFALCISANEANLRYGPGTNYKRTLEGYKYMPLNKISAKGNWYWVWVQDGTIHWIHRKLVTSAYKCASVKTKEARIRSGPGTNYDEILYSPSLKYYSFKVLKQKSGWVRVQDDLGDKGWIYKNLLWIN